VRLIGIPPFEMGGVLTIVLAPLRSSFAALLPVGNEFLVILLPLCNL